MIKWAVLGSSSLLLALTTAAGPVGAQAAAPRPSFSCAKAATPAERTICRDPELARLDRIMADLFAETRSLLLNDQQSAEADRTQRTWLATRGRCRDAQCLRRAYFGRIAELARDLPADG